MMTQFSFRSELSLFFKPFSIQKSVLFQKLLFFLIVVVAAVPSLDILQYITISQKNISTGLE